MAAVMHNHGRVATVSLRRDQLLGNAMHGLLEIHCGLRPEAAENSNCFHDRSFIFPGGGVAARPQSYRRIRRLLKGLLPSKPPACVEPQRYRTSLSGGSISMYFPIMSMTCCSAHPRPGRLA